MAEPLGGTDGFKRSADNQTRSNLVRVVAEPMLQQLGVRKDDAELVVQSVEQSRHLGQPRVGRGATGRSGITRHG